MTVIGLKTPCLDENDAIRIVLDPLDARVAASRAHVDECDACRELVAAVARFVVVGDERTGPRWIDTELPPGTELGAYRIVEVIGHGAMGRVYLAEDQRLERRVALKLLDMGLRDAVAQRRIRAEARSMARLRDPHVVEVFDVGTSPYGPYVAMFYVDGWDLKTWLAAEPRSCTEIIDCLEQAGRGLAAAHAAAVVHRDFKPANILVGRDGVVRVADFGLAVVRGAVTSTTGPSPSPGTIESRRTNGVAGTPAYMAPEQVAGGQCGPAADQFAYCMTLFEALAGHRPFAEATPAQRQGAIEAGRVRAPQRPIPRAVLTVIRRGLRAEPDQRFEGMTALLRALGRPPFARWRVWVGMTVAMLVGAPLVLGSDPQEPPQCSTQTPAPWPDESRSRMQAAWDRIGAPAYTTTRLLQQLDAHALAWTDLHRSTCIAVTREATPTVLARLDCLEQTSRQFEIFVGAAESAMPSMVEGYATTAARLRPPSDCTRDDSPWLNHPELATEVSSLRNTYLRILARGGHDRLPALRADILVTIERAERAGASVEQATLCHLVGVLDTSGGERESASQWFERAYFLARTNAASGLAYDAAVANGVVLGTHLHQVDDAQQWFRHARAALGDLDDNERRARLLLREGDLQMLTSDNDAALASFRNAEALLAGGVPAWLPTDLYGSIGQVLALQGDEAGCRDAFEEAISNAERTLGPEHRDLIRPLQGLAGCELNPDSYHTGLAHLERALQLSVHHRYEYAEAMIRGNLGLFHSVLEHPTASLRELLRSDELLRASYPEGHFTVAQSSSQLADAYLATGHWLDAATSASAALRAFERQPIDAGSLVYDCELIVAHADLMLGEPGMVERLGELLAHTPSDRSGVEAAIAFSQALLAEARYGEVIATLASMFADEEFEPEISILHFAEARLFYAQALLAEGDVEEGQRQLERALALASPYEADDPRGVVERIRQWR